MISNTVCLEWLSLECAKSSNYTAQDLPISLTTIVIPFFTSITSVSNWTDSQTLAQVTAAGINTDTTRVLIHYKTLVNARNFHCMVIGY